MIAKLKWTILAGSLLVGFLLSSAPAFAAAPSITTPPHNQSVAAGGTVTLAPVVSGSAPLGYQWWKDGSLLLGATSGSLTLASAQVTNSGAYYLVVTNASGTAVSLPALVHVGTPTLYAWGDNLAGAFGDGTNNEVTVPLNTSNNAVVLAAGADFSLYVDANGVLWATGTNSAGTNAIGQLGIDSTVVSANIPFQVATNVVAVAAGYQHSLFVKGDSSLWAMGDNSFGQLGVPLAITNSILPLYVATNVVAVAAGYQHSLFLKADGTVWSMGSNIRGQLGAGIPAGFTNQPQLISTSGASLAGGGFHSLFITANGVLWGAGNNVEGELGLGVSNLVTIVPVPIATNVISAAAGWQHSLFVKNDGSLWTMGTNSFGQLGLNENVLAANYVPQQVTLTSNVVAVTAGFNYSLFLRTDGSLWAMGDDEYGQLGDSGNDAVDSFVDAPPADHVNTVPVPVLAPGLAYGSFRSGPAANHSLSTAFGTLFPPAVGVLVQGNAQPGYTFNLVAETGGSAPFAYQWWKNGVMLAGATNSELAINHAALTDSGAYTVVVTNLMGAAVSLPELLLLGNPVLAGWGDNTAGQFGAGTGGYVTNGPVLTTNNSLIMAAGGASTIYVNAFNNGYFDSLFTAGANGSGQLGNGSYAGTNGPQTVARNNILAVAAGQAFSLYITNDGTLWGMGDNTYGQLGLGAGVLNTNLPVPLATNVAAVAAGFQHTLIVRANGTLWGLGNNVDGQLGNGSYASTNQPVLCASNVVTAAAGAHHSLFLKVDGSLWGMGDNSAGQLGLGISGTNMNLPALVATNVSAVTAGAGHSLFIKQDGTLWGMGDNSQGQLGLGAGVANTNVPVLIASNVVAVAAGSQHSLFEEADGSLWTMGNNASGQLGDGTFTNSYVPEPIMPGYFIVVGIASGAAASDSLVVGMPLAPTITQPTNQTVSSGGSITFSTSVTGFGKLTCQWMKNGTMLPGANTSTFTITNAQFNNSGCYSVFVTNDVGMTISLPAMAVVATPALFSCGDNTDGELGLGTNSPNSLAIATGTANSAVAASAGNDYTLFIDAQGVLWGVGANASGELGLGTNTTFSNVVTPIGSNVVAAAAGRDTTLFIKNDGSLWGVGDNGNYQFGQIGPVYTNRTMQLTNFIGRAVAVSGGSYHSLVLKSDGTLYGAGANYNGQLGLGSGSYISAWTVVATGVASISAGGMHSAFLKADGTLWTMGVNQNGEMGNGTITSDQTTPIPVTNHVIGLVAGYNNTLFVRNDGTLWGMGYNSYGQLGDGTDNDTNRPVMVATNVASVTASQENTLFLKSDDTLWAMGYNGSGATGLGPYLTQTNQPGQLLAGTPVAGVFSSSSAIHTLIVAPPAPPVITAQPANQTLAVGNTAQFAVGAYGFPPLFYQWQFNGTNLNGFDANPLVIPSLVSSNAGGYKLIVTNPGGSITSTQAILSLAAPANFTSISRLAGNSVKLLCASNALTIPGRIVAATNLLTPMAAWATLTNLPAGPVAPVSFTDTTATNYPRRFYRLAWP